MTIQTAELKMYGTVAVPGYTGLTFLGKKLGKVVGDPLTIELAETMAPHMTKAQTQAQKKAPIPAGPAFYFSEFRPMTQAQKEAQGLSPNGRLSATSPTHLRPGPARSHHPW